MYTSGNQPRAVDGVRISYGESNICPVKKGRLSAPVIIKKKPQKKSVVDKLRKITSSQVGRRVKNVRLKDKQSACNSKSDCNSTKLFHIEPPIRERLFFGENKKELPCPSSVQNKHETSPRFSSSDVIIQQDEKVGDSIDEDMDSFQKVNNVVESTNGNIVSHKDLTTYLSTASRYHENKNGNMFQCQHKYYLTKDHVGSTPILSKVPCCEKRRLLDRYK